MKRAYFTSGVGDGAASLARRLGARVLRRDGRAVILATAEQWWALQLSLGVMLELHAITPGGWPTMAEAKTWLWMEG